MLDFSQYEVISFDCYGTLIDWETGIFSALRPILAAHGKNIADAELLKLYSELEAEAEQGEFRPYREVLEVGCARVRQAPRVRAHRVPRPGRCPNRWPTGGPFPTP